MFAWVLIFINSNFYIFQHNPTLTCFFCNLTTKRKQMLPPCLLQWEAPVKTLLFSSSEVNGNSKNQEVICHMSSYKIIQVICDHFSPSLVAPNVPVWDVHSMKNLICSTAGDTLLSHLGVRKTTMSSPVLEKWWEKHLYHTCWLSDLACLLDFTWFQGMISVFFSFFRKRIPFVSCVDFFTIWINKSAAQSARSNRQYQLKGPTWLKATKATAALVSWPHLFRRILFPALTAHHGILYSLGKCANIHISIIKTRTDFECRYFFTYSSRNLQEIPGIQL